MHNTEQLKARLRFGTASMLIGAMGLMGTAGAIAQDTDVADEDIEEVVVTGTRIVRSGASAPAPVTILNSEAISLAGEVNIATLLNQLPALGSTFSQAASSGFIGTTGLSFLDLRRLGTDRTLVLVNGRRHVGSQAGSAGVDINSIPQELVQSVEVLTGGASAIYGADAVTGVVNFKTKQDFEGISVFAQYGDADQGGSQAWTTRMIVGSNFADGKGNAVFSFEYSDVEGFEARQRDWERRDFRLVPNPANAGDPNDGTANGIPNQIYIEGATLNFITEDGIFFGLGGTFDDWKYTSNGFELFDGGERFGNSSIGGDGIPLVDIGGSLQPDASRYIATGQIRYELTENVNFFAEMKYINSQAESINGTGPFDIFSRSITSEYGFLTDADRQFMADNGIGSFLISRSHQEAMRTSAADRSLFRAVGGFDGELGETMNFELSYVHGRSRVSVRDNNRINDRFTAGLDAVVDPATGEVVCRSDLEGPGDLPGFAVDGCVPINVLGFNAISQEAVDWFTADAFITETVEQNVVSGYIGGDSSEAGFELPAGPIGWVIGGEYREELARSNPAVVDELGITFGNEIPPTVGGFDVWEAFAEVSVPLLSGETLAEELTFDAAIRFSDYSTVGSTTTWNLGMSWVPVEQVRFRGTYSKAVRAPNISELFGPQSQTFLFYDHPCDSLRIAAGTEFRAANCAALGITQPFTQEDGQGNTPGTSGGNPNVGEEESTSWTVGAVFTPEFAPGLSITVDYWNFEITDAIAAASLNDTFANCVDAPTLDNAFCRALTINPTTAELDTFELTQQNFAALEASGIDAEINYVWDLSGMSDSTDLGSIDFRLVGTYLINNDSFPFQTNPTFVDEEKGELGDPEWNANFNATWRITDWTFNYELRYISSMLLVEQDDLEAVPDLQDITETGDAWYHDIQVRYQVTEDIEFFAGINNLFEEHPPLNLSGAGTGSAIFDNIGRFYYGGLRANF